MSFRKFTMMSNVTELFVKTSQHFSPSSLYSRDVCSRYVHSVTITLHSVLNFCSVYFCYQDEDSIQLTPEQQRQLEMIENMPFTVSKENEEHMRQSVEDRDAILGMSCWVC